ncbi:MAG: hypothetical protein F4Z95_00155 [Gammaproteobacteria bacterium]|nr:hypothetical protein [Gammaproteobacteria bacterium]
MLADADEHCHCLEIPLSGEAMVSARSVHDHLQQQIPAQLVMIVQLFIVQRQGIHPLANDLWRVKDATGPAVLLPFPNRA